jgi:DNA primase
MNTQQTLLRPNEVTRTSRGDRAPDVLTAAHRYYSQRLHSDAGAAARQYLAEHCELPADAADRYGLGWADGGLYSYLVEELGIDPSDCIAAGLLECDDIGRLRDVLNGRLVVPSVVDGQVVHLVGRAIDNPRPTYIHTGGPVRYCYNEDAYGWESCILVDDPLDAIALRGLGYLAMAAPDGDPALVRSLLARRGRPAKPVHICFPGDERGDAQALYVAQILGADARIVSLPRHFTPGAMYRRRATGLLERRLQDAQELIVWLIERIDPTVPRPSLRRQLQPVLERLAELDPASQEAYLDVVARRFGLSWDERRAYRQTACSLNGADPGIAPEDAAPSLPPPLQVASPERDEEGSDSIAWDSDPGDGFDARLLRCLASLRDRVQHGRLPVMAVTEAFNEGKSEGMSATPAAIGRRLSALGIEKRRGAQGRSVILWDDRHLRRVTLAHGLAPERPSPAPN